MKETILIIGGAGYIGSHQVERMNQDGYRVVVLDNLSTGFRQALNSNIDFVHGDVRDYEILKKIFTKYKIDAVIHFAALSRVGESVFKPLEYYDNNVTGMQILLQAMTDFNIKNIIFSSTAAVYGEVGKNKITEETPKNPISPYGETKLAMEKMVKWVGAANNIKYVSLRYFNVCGASESGNIGECHDPESHLIPIVLQAALGKKAQVDIYGDDYDTSDGTCVRDYIHVEDLVDGHSKALEYLKDGGCSDIFNLGYEEGFSVKEIIDTAKEITGCQIKTNVVARRMGDPDILVASSKKAREVLKWDPKYNDIKYIIKSAYKFHQKYPNGYKNE
ncbi:MAG: UDP-glucose 4-epimerase GalE [Bacilli bacterium]